MAAPSPKTVIARLKALRALMAEAGIDVILVPSADEHQNEYLPNHTLRREAISGFTGSAGDVAVTRQSAHLFVDSRYHLQGEQETDPEVFHLHKLGVAGESDLNEWLGAHEQEAGPLRVGFDPFLHTLKGVEGLRKALRHPDSNLAPLAENLVDRVWEDRPAPPARPVYVLPEAMTGEPVAGKLERVREAMAEAGAEALVLSKLDEVAWLTNLRGSDISFNPVFTAYMILTGAEAVCYTDNPLEPSVEGALKGLVTFAPYKDLPGALEARKEQGGTVWLDAAGVSEGLRLALGNTTLCTTSPNPVVRFKARKNPVELETIREAHLHAGAAKVRSFSLLSSMLRKGEKVSEAGYADLLLREYASEEGFADLSFGTISAYGPNAAIVHYGTPNPDCLLEPGGMLLVDSGVQLAGATTDDTRTIAIGEPDDRQRLHFTDVLRGHIRLAMQVFPEGTTGQMLDALARSPLWNEGLDYGHGTGHGVGAFLNVHEGPHGISHRSTVPLEAGMIVSNEPGYYRTGWGGIRCENLYVVEEALGLPHHPGGKGWLRMSPLTMIPFDRALIDWRRLTYEELQWLVDYHRLVDELLSPRLPEPHRAWLREACQPPGDAVHRP